MEHSSSPGRVLITGASGFIGRHAVAALTRRGHTVVAMSRLPRDFANPLVQWQPGDVEDAESIRGVAEGCHAVVHLAGLAHRVTGRPPSSQEFDRVNAGGTRSLLQEARRAGVSRFVYMSSVAAASDDSGSGMLRETDPPAPRDGYGQSKLKAESLVANEAALGAMWTCTLRPPMVYGPGNRGNLPRLYRLVRRGLPLPFASVRNARSMIFIDNLVDAILAVLDRSLASGSIFYVSDGEAISTPDLIRLLSTYANRPARLFSLPTPLLKVIGRMGDVASLLLPVPVRSDVLHRLTTSLVVDDSSFRRHAGYTPKSGIREGLQKTVRSMIAAE